MAWGGSACAICRSWQREVFCAACLARFAVPMSPLSPVCAVCAMPAAEPGVLCARCQADRPPFERTIAALRYGPPWQRVIHNFKRLDGAGWARPLSALMGERLQAAYAGQRWPERIVPVPLARGRLLARGHNPAWELARGLAALLHLPAQPSAVLRCRETPSQRELSRADRLHNLRGAFVVSPDAQALFRGARVAVVDDVMTTGATVTELALALHRAGVQSVHVWVLARTPLEGA